MADKITDGSHLNSEAIVRSTAKATILSGKDKIQYFAFDDGFLAESVCNCDNNWVSRLIV